MKCKCGNAKARNKYRNNGIEQAARLVKRALGEESYIVHWLIKDIRLLKR